MQCSKLDFEFGVAATMPPLRVHLQARRTRSVSSSGAAAGTFIRRRRDAIAETGLWFHRISADAKAQPSPEEAKYSPLQTSFAKLNVRLSHEI
jgi:hypothetical protein